MPFSRAFFAIFALAVALPAAPAAAQSSCKIGDVCVIQSPLFGCKDGDLIKRWIDLCVDENREAAEQFISEQTASGQCARFRAGERLKLMRYLGMRRLEVQRPGESQTFIMLLK